MATIQALLPPNAVDTDLNQLVPVLKAQDECQILLGDNEVTVLEDPELEKDCVEIMGQASSVQFDCDSILQYLAVHIKDIGKYLTLEVEVVDDAKQYRVFKIANTTSTTRIELHECHMPLVTKRGWNYLNLDLEKLTRVAFGTTYLSVVQVRVYANCRLLHVYLQDRAYSDAELPAYLNVINVS